MHGQETPIAQSNKGRTDEYLLIEVPPRSPSDHPTFGEGNGPRHRRSSRTPKPGLGPSAEDSKNRVSFAMPQS